MARTALACCAVVLAGTVPTAHGQHVHELAYVATLTGANELLPNDSPGVGQARVMIDLVFFTMRVEVEFSGLAGAVTAAHVHGMTALSGQGVADPINALPSLPEFPTGVAAGGYDKTISLGFASSYNPAYIAANGGTVSLASNALFKGMSLGHTYVNLHTTAFPDGEIRGFLLPVPPADFNFNGIVEGSDLDVWRQQFAFDHGGDANGDGQSDGADFLVWQRQLGAVATIPDGHPHGLLPVPEPATGGLLWVALGLAAGRRLKMVA